VRGDSRDRDRVTAGIEGESQLGVAVDRVFASRLGEERARRGVEEAESRRQSQVASSPKSTASSPLVSKTYSPRSATSKV
jgi:hypothetical protein